MILPDIVKKQKIMSMDL